jgi:FkbM family methyltransferase
MPRTRGPVHRLVRRVPGVQALYGELRLQLALRRRIATLDHPGTDVRIRVPTRSIARLRVRPVEKEPWTVRWLEQELRPGDVLWDVGANVGSYALIAARLEPGARVVAVEPGYANYAALCENVQLNGLGGRVLALPAALAESSRLGELSLAEVEPGAAIHQLDAERPGPNVQAVVVHALDELVQRFGLPAPTLLKVDVDGAEPAVLAGAAAALAREELRSVIVEIEEENGDPVVAALGTAGLGLHERIAERDGVPLPGVWYGVFRR